MSSLARPATTPIEMSSLPAGSATTERALQMSRSGSARCIETGFLGKPSFGNGFRIWSGYVLVNSSHRKWLANNSMQRTALRAAADAEHCVSGEAEAVGDEKGGLMVDRLEPTTF